MYYSGQIRDAETEYGIPSATLRFTQSGITVGNSVADRNGNFTANTNYDADQVTISSAGYKTFQFPLYGNYQHTFDLERDIITLPPVVIHPPPKPGPAPKPGIGIAIPTLAGLALMALMLMMIKRKE